MEFRKMVTITLSAGLEETQETIQTKVVANYTHTHTHTHTHARNLQLVSQGDKFNAHLHFPLYYL